MDGLTPGIYRVFKEGEATNFIGSSYNTMGTMKRLRFELTLNACSYKALQEYWNTHGEMHFELYEAVERPQGMTDIEFEGLLYARLLNSKHILGEGTRLIQQPV